MAKAVDIKLGSQVATTFWRTMDLTNSYLKTIKYYNPNTNHWFSG